MIERILQIETGDGKMETFVAHPEQGGPFPAVVLYMDAPGIREELYDFARRVGTVGYYCLVPDQYYRQGKVRFDLGAISEDLRRKWRSARDKVSNAMIVVDARALLRFMENGEPVRSGPKGCIGYCMGGRFALAAAGAFPEAFRASASLHGTQLITDRADSPHLMADRFQGELYLGFAENDPHVPLEEVERLREVFARGALKHQIEVHPGTEHGYSFPAWPTYRKAAAERNWERIFAMFRRQIPPAA